MKRICTYAASPTTVMEAMRLISEQHPDIVLADISLGADNGFALLDGVASGKNPIPVIVLSMHDEQFFADRAMKSGARGYVSKQDAPETIVKAIREVMAGENFFSKTSGRRKS